MKKLLVLMFLSVSVFAQKSINNYKYIVVPKQMETFDEPNKHETSSLTKFLFNKNGFNAFLSDDNFPEDLAQNKCLALTAVLKDDSGMFSTKTTLLLKDCYNEVVFTGEEGKSKIKDFKRAYHDAVRKTFSSIKRLNYHYKPNTEQKKSMNLNVSVNRSKNLELVSEKATKSKKEESSASFDLTASSTVTGYQLRDKNSDIVFELLRTSNPELFILKDKNGVLIKNNGVWMAQYYEGDKIVMKPFKVKF
ncbi:hypothetical protein [Tenacibaculum sp. 190524A05c]|uniref:SH3 domain-containing protein n=1 Tax=Tenacibaculum platacis TaxID=3137852 RepID=A0ABM9NQK6_9FLAO